MTSKFVTNIEPQPIHGYSVTLMWPVLTIQHSLATRLDKNRHRIAGFKSEGCFKTRRRGAVERKSAVALPPNSTHAWHNASVNSSQQMSSVVFRRLGRYEPAGKRS